MNSSFIKVIVSCLCIVFSVSGQENFQGIATYKSSRKTTLRHFGEKLQNDKKDKEIRKFMQQLTNESHRQTYTLKFTKNESHYKREEKLTKPNFLELKGAMVVVHPPSLNIYYKNFDNNSYTRQVEIEDKKFLIKDSIPNQEWQLTSETKNIGNYTCYKAVLKDSVIEMKTNEDGLLEENVKNMTITAWYTPQIPVSNGPREFGGLPGLILEINDGELTLICSKIVMNPEKRFKIKKPRKGKVITNAKYLGIQKKKREEALERNKYRRRAKKIESFDDF